LRKSYIDFPTRGIILMYHRVADVVCDPWALAVSPEKFNEQIDLISQNFNTIGLSHLCLAGSADNLPFPWVAITFDDGYVDNYQIASKILNNHDLPATFFLVGKYIDSKHNYWWDELFDLLLKPGQLPPWSDLTLDMDITEDEWQDAIYYLNDDYMNFKYWRFKDEDVTPRHKLFRKIYFLLRAQKEEQRQKNLIELRLSFDITVKDPSLSALLSSEEIKLLAKEELFEIGAHSMTHMDLASLSKQQQYNEIIGSKKTLEQLIGTPVVSFSYPYGIKTPETISLVQEAGFSCACSVEEGITQEATNLYELPRLEMKNWDAYQLNAKLKKMLLE